MPWRLIVFILIFAVFLAFVTFNLDNRCDISFGFAEIKDVPVFLSVFISFAIGLLCAFPLLMFLKNKKKPVVLPREPSAPVVPDEKIKQEAEAAKKRFLSKKDGR